MTASVRPADFFDLYDFRRRVFRLYAERDRELRAGESPAAVCARFRQARDAMFATHPQSALDAGQKQAFRGLPYFEYDSAACVEAVIDTVIEPGELRIELSDDDAVTLRRAAYVRFAFNGQPAVLTLYWIDVYGGGLFMPFRDATAPTETYGGGRYVVDTVKGSDFIRLSAEGDSTRVLLDFNYAYNPSCAYNYRWVCPLAPEENHLPMPVCAGERAFSAASLP